MVCALNALAGDVLSAENTSLYGDPSHIDAATTRLLEGLFARRIDPRSYLHVRLGGVEPEESVLFAERFDLSPFGKNVWFATIGSTRYEVVSVDALKDALDGIWVPSPLGKDALVASGFPESRIWVIPLGVSDSFFVPAPRTPKREGQVVFLTFVTADGIRGKGFDALLETFEAVFGGDDRAILHVHAKKGARAVRDAIERYTLRSNVLMTDDYVADIRQLFWQADCFVQPSRSEAWGLAALEAMACGLPVVVTDWGGFREFARGPGVFKVPVKLVTSDGEARGEWAEPDRSALADALSLVAEQHAELETLGRECSMEARRWTWSKAAECALAAASDLSPR